MSYAVFPSLPGLDISVKRSQIHSTLIQPGGVPGVEQRASFSPGWPQYSWELTLNFLRQAGFNEVTISELKTLAAFFNARDGRFETFLFTDPVESSVSAQALGTTDGTTTAYQLLDSLGNPIYDVHGTPTIYLAGTATTAWTLGSTTGVITFTSAPATGQALTGSYSYYRRVRFDQDTLDIERIVALCYKAESLKLITRRS